MFWKSYKATTVYKDDQWDIISYHLKYKQIKLTLSLKSNPLLQQMLLAIDAGLHPAHGVNRSTPARPGMLYQTRKKGLLRRVRRLLGRYEVETAPFELVPAHVTHLGDGVFVGHAEIQDVGARGRVGVLAVEDRRNRDGLNWHVLLRRMSQI